MMPGKYNMTIFRGGTFDVSLKAKDLNGDVNFSDTYTSAAMHIYKAWLTNLDDSPDNFLFELSTENGMITISNTVIGLHIPASVTRTMTFESGIYLLKLIVDGADPIIDPFLHGELKIENGAV